MGRGCLILTVVFGVALHFERSAVLERGLPAPWVLSSLLAASLTLAIGSLQGLTEAYRRRREPETARTDWRDGEPVRTGGRIEPSGPILRSPLGDREAVVFEYSILRHQTRSEGGELGQAQGVGSPRLTPAASRWCRSCSVPPKGRSRFTAVRPSTTSPKRTIGATRCEPARRSGWPPSNGGCRLRRGLDRRGRALRAEGR